MCRALGKLQTPILLYIFDNGSEILKVDGEDRTKLRFRCLVTYCRKGTNSNEDAELSISITYSSVVQHRIYLKLTHALINNNYDIIIKKEQNHYFGL